MVHAYRNLARAASACVVFSREYYVVNPAGKITLKNNTGKKIDSINVKSIIKAVMYDPTEVKYDKSLANGKTGEIYINYVFNKIAQTIIIIICRRLRI